MLLINKNHYLYLTDISSQESWRNKPSGNLSLLNNMKGLNPKIFYYYVEVKNFIAVKKLKDNLPKLVIDGLKSQNLTLIICNAHEAFHSLIEPLYYDFILPFDLNEDNIIIISESADIHHQISNVAQQSGRKPIKSIWSRIFEFNVSMQINRQITQENKTFPTLHYKTYTKKFINFNRRWRLHRPVLVGAMAARNLLDKGYVSLAHSEDGWNWQNYWQQILNQHSEEKFPYIGKLLRDNETLIRSIPPMYLDTDELMVNKATLMRSTDQYYQNTYFSVVHETNFYISITGEEPGRFFSEKTFKPIGERHPFILVNPPYSLSKLREIGYQTFNPYIDESYDEELNDDKRMKMILDEIERLCNLNDSELQDFLVKCAPICDHNQTVLRNKKLQDFSEFLNA